MLFTEASRLDELLRCDLVGRFEQKLRDYLELFD